MGKPTTLILLALAVFAGCVELDGQRISMRYDAAEDRLELLLFYDGIHDSGSDGDGKGVEQIPTFVKGGEFLLLDWPFHYQPKEIRERLANKGEEGLDAVEREFLEYFLANVVAAPIGHYRDPEGRIGAAQIVTFRKASRMIRLINALLNREILEEEPEREIARTVAKMKEGAKKGAQWARLDGHSIVFEVPVHLPEWHVIKAKLAKEIMKEPKMDDEEDTPHFLVQLLSTTPFSVTESPEKLLFRLGAKSRPSTFRYRIRESKKTGLDEAVVNAVPRDLDIGISANLIGDAKDSPPALAAIHRWGPPEEKVRALIRTIKVEENAERKAAAVKLLREFGTRWNDEVGLPKAPGFLPEHAWLKAWTKWYGRMLRFPEGEKAPLSIEPPEMAEPEAVEPEDVEPEVEEEPKDK
jgi:hypothetical protein